MVKRVEKLNGGTVERFISGKDTRALRRWGTKSFRNKGDKTARR